MISGRLWADLQGQPAEQASDAEPDRVGGVHVPEAARQVLGRGRVQDLQHRGDAVANLRRRARDCAVDAGLEHRAAGC